MTGVAFAWDHSARAVLVDDSFGPKDRGQAFSPLRAAVAAGRERGAGRLPT
ncbi:hypothetical protein [Amycolatopsis sp. NPDC003676]